jgi:hypothetical protein
MKPVPFDDQMGLLSAHRKEMMIEIEMETTTTKIYKSPMADGTYRGRHGGTGSAT